MKLLQEAIDGLKSLMAIGNIVSIIPAAVAAGASWVAGMSPVVSVLAAVAAGIVTIFVEVDTEISPEEEEESYYE